MIRRAPLRRTSTGLCATKRAQRRVYAQVDAESAACCFSCGCHGPTDHSHILPQGMNKMLRANPLNILPECRACHTMWGERLTEYAKTYPEALAEKVRRMQLLDRQRWAFWMMKNSHLLPPQPPTA